MILSQLVYVSVRKADCTRKDIDDILAASNRNNGKLDITGVLLFSNTKFLQVLEGKKSLILELYDKIKSDNRHKNVILISLMPITVKTFPSWQMGSREIDTDSYDFLTDMTEEDKVEFKAILEGRHNERAIQLINKLF